MNTVLDSLAIRQILPHRYPFLLVDKIVELEEDKKIIGIKNVSNNEHFFQGHFPDYPVMPGVLIVEALAQTGAVLLLKKPEYQGKIALLAGVDKTRFKRQVLPGDIVRLEVEVIKLRRGIGKAKGKAFVGDELACEAELMFAIQN